MPNEASVPVVGDTECENIPYQAQLIKERLQELRRMESDELRDRLALTSRGWNDPASAFEELVRRALVPSLEVTAFRNHIRLRVGSEEWRVDMPKDLVIRLEEIIRELGV